MSQNCKHVCSCILICLVGFVFLFYTFNIILRSVHRFQQTAQGPMGKGRKRKRETSDTTLFINEKLENLNLQQIESLKEMIA